MALESRNILINIITSEWKEIIHLKYEKVGKVTYKLNGMGIKKYTNKHYYKLMAGKYTSKV